MKPVIKIGFADFVSRFDPKDNYFTNLLSKKYQVEISNDPDILICSCYHAERFKYDCIKIFYTGENQRPDFREYDFAMTFDYCNDPRHYRLPLYVLYIDQAEGQRKNGRVFNEFSKRETITETLCRFRTEDEARRIWRSKKEFCCILNSNPSATFRLGLVDKLSKYKIVASAGAHNNNIGYRVNDKIDFISNYRFVFAMENTSSEGYITEKIVEPFFVDSIPLYWGNPLVGRDFNTDAFINYHDFESEDAFVERIIEIDKNEDLAIHMLMQPKFTNGKVNEFMDEENVMRFLSNIIRRRNEITPVSATWKGRVYNAKHILRDKRNALAATVKNIIKAPK